MVRHLHTKFLTAIFIFLFSGGAVSGQTCATIKAAGLVYCNNDDEVVLSAETSKGTCTDVGNTIEWYSSAAIDIPLATGCNFTTPKLQGDIKYYVRDNTDQSQVITDQVGFDFNDGGLTNEVYDQYDGNIRTQFTPTKDFILNSFEAQIANWNSNTPTSLLVEVRNYSDRDKDSIFTIDISSSATYIDGEILSLDLGYTFAAYDEYDISFAANGIQIFGFEGTSGSTIDYDAAFGSILEITSSGTEVSRTNGIDGFGPFFNWDIQAELGSGCQKKEVNVIQRCIEICDDGIDNDSDGDLDEACEAFSCDGKLLQSIGDKLFEMSVSPVEFTEINNFPFGINSLGYSAADNKVYALIFDNSSADHGKIVRIASDGEYQVLDKLLTKDGTLIEGGFAADIGSDGNYYFLDEPTSTLYVFELVTLTEVSRTVVNYPVRIADIAFNPTTGTVFGITGGANKQMYEFNPKTGVTTTYPVIKFLDEDGNEINNAATGGVVGGIYFLPNGKMIAYGSFLGSSDQNDMIQIDLESHAIDGSVLVLDQNNLNAQSNDGASCPYSLLIEKTANVTEVEPNEEIEYTIDFINNTGFEIPKIDFSDSLSDYLTLTDITHNDLGNSNIIAGSGIGTKTLIINDVNIPIGQSSITFTVKVNPDSICEDDIIYNQARVDSLAIVLGSFSLSDNPLTPAENDATPVNLKSVFDITPPILDATNPICINDTLVLNATSTNSDYLNWYNDNGYTNVGLTDTILNSRSTDAGTYYAFIDSAGCSTDTSEIEIFINPLPIATIDPINSFCLGDSVELFANSDIPSSTFRWILDTDSLTSVSINNPLAFSIGETTHTVEVTSPLGCLDTTNITIKATELPIIIAPVDTSICLGESAVFTASGADTYLWTDDIDLNSNTGSSVISTPTTNRQYIVTGTNAVGCSNTDTINIMITTVNPPTITSNAPVCQNDSLILSATTPSPDYIIWYSTTPYTSNNVSDTILNAELTDAGTYYAYTDSSGCKSDTVETIVIINPLPNISIDPTPLYCAGDSIQLQANSDILSSKFNWIADTTSLTDTTIANPLAFSIEETTHIVEVTSPQGCIDTTEITIEASNLPTVVAPEDTVICFGEKVTLSANGANTYNWRNNIELSTNSGATVIATPSINRTYIVTGTNSVGCINSDTVTVTVNSKPVLTEISDAQICEGDSVVLSTSGVDSLYSWSPQTFLKEISLGDAISTPDNDINYQVIGTNTDGCKDTITFNITVNIVPELELIKDTIEICNGDQGTFEVTGSGVDSLYSWSPAIGLNNTSTDQVTSSHNADITYQLIGFNTGGCSDTINAKLIVLDDPIPSVQISNPGDICTNENLSFDIISSQNLGDAPIYNWYSIEGSTKTLLGNDASLALFDLTKDISIVLEATSSITCVPSSSSTVNSNQVSSIINLYPDLEIDGKSTVCKGYSNSLTVIDNNGVANSYLWYKNINDTILNSTSNTLLLEEVNTDQTIKVTASENGCSDTAFINLDIIDVMVDISAVKTLIFEGNEAQLLVSTNGTSITGSTDNTNIDFDWQIDQTSQNIKLSDTTLFIVTATDRDCEATDSIKINILKSLNAPYFFSPDDDGFNDLWIVKELDTYKDTKINIFNRWGSKIIKLEDQENTWDGKYKNGNDVPEGVYFYVIEGDAADELVSLTGYVNLVRK